MNAERISHEKGKKESIDDGKEEKTCMIQDSAETDEAERGKMLGIRLFMMEKTGEFYRKYGAAI